MKKISGMKNIYRCTTIGGFILVAYVLLIMPTGEALARSDRYDLDVSLYSYYDDNILDYADADLDLINDPDVPLNRYGIKSRDDYILNPRIGFTYKTALAGHTLHLGAIFEYYYYKRNDIKRYSRFEPFFRRYFARGLYFQGSLVYIPDYYFRNSYITGEGYYEAKFDKILLEAKIAIPVKEKLQANGYYRYSHKDFIPIFDERDINEHELEGEFIYHPIGLWKGWGSYAYTHAVAAGADNPRFLRDTSFDAYLFTLGSRLYFRGINRKSFQIAARATYERVYFQTSKITPEDRYRLGRKDNRWYITLIADHAVTRSFRVGVQYYRMDKEVDLPAIELKQFLESSSNSIYFILEYSL